MFRPPIATLIKAIDNDLLEVLPFMKSKLVQNYLAIYPETAKGRMKRPRKGILITRARPEGRVTYTISTIEEPALHLIPIEDPSPHLIPDDEVPTVYLV